jgi:hypothetical protein
VGDGTFGTFGTEVTTIRYASGQEAKAALLAAHLVTPGADLVLGDNYRHRILGGRITTRSTPLADRWLDSWQG